MIRLKILNCRRSKRTLVISNFILVSFMLIFLNALFSSDKIVNTTCHYEFSNDTFSILGKSSYLPSRSIFFQVTSCPGYLSPRDYCAVESTAAAHPDWQINVIFSGPTPTRPMEQMNNVKFWRIYNKAFVKGTPFEHILESKVLKTCRWGIELVNDIIKYLILSRWGGIYIDLDIVVARPLGSLVRNWAARINDVAIGENILAFSKDFVGKNVSELTIKQLQTIFKTGHCGSVKPTVMTSVLQSFCTTPEAAYMSSATCNGFEVYGPQFFNFIPENRARNYFVPGELEIHNAYTYHLWGHISKEYKVMKTSPYAKLAKRYCPLTLKLYSDHFGL